MEDRKHANYRAALVYSDAMTASQAFIILQRMLIAIMITMPTDRNAFRFWQQNHFQLVL